MATAVFCLADTESTAVSIVSQLKRSGFSDNDISVLFPDRTGTRDFAHEQHTKAPEGAATGAATGGVVGGVVGLLTGIGLLAIPGLGPFVAAGPILAALGGLGVGGAAGGIVGALVGLGIPELEAKSYEGKVKGGNILISAHAESSAEVHKAKEIYENNGGKDIVSTHESPAPRADRSDRPRGADMDTSACRDPAVRDYTTDKR